VLDRFSLLRSNPTQAKTRLEWATRSGHPPFKRKSWHTANVRRGECEYLVRTVNSPNSTAISEGARQLSGFALGYSEHHAIFSLVRSSAGPIKKQVIC
jgi:hypothetical protein